VSRDEELRPTRGIIVDEHTAVVTEEAFNKMLEYSCSMPTGQGIGKRWKRKADYYDESKGWFMLEYVEVPEPGMVGVKWRELLVV
jgi:hypothetical protein